MKKTAKPNSKDVTADTQQTSEKDTGTSSSFSKGGPSTAVQMLGRSYPPRSPSPIWDIELDLNDTPPPEDEEDTDSRLKKKQKVDHPFGVPQSILDIEATQ